MGVVKRFHSRMEKAIDQEIERQEEEAQEAVKITAGTQVINKAWVEAQKNDMAPGNVYLEPLRELKQYVDNMNQQPSIVVNIHGTKRFRDQKEFPQVTVHGVEFEYALDEKPNGICRRMVLIKLKGERLEDIPDKQLEPIMVAVCDVFFDLGGGPPNVLGSAEDCIAFYQDFAPVYLAELNPNLVSKGPLGKVS